MKTNFKADFPLLCSQDIAYLDNSATAQRPQCVLDAVQDFYRQHNANPLRGFYDLAAEATDEYENARDCVKDFIHARKSAEIIFTRNTSESVNLVAYSYGLNFLKPGDEILITIAEHHSNMLPWQMVAEKTGATLRYLDCDQNGFYSDEAIQAAVTPNTKFAAIQHVSNVLGGITPIEKIIPLVHAKNFLFSIIFFQIFCYK